MSEIAFKSDTKHRKQWFTGMSFSHPAKMMLPLQLWLIENFTSEGETILDPMAGSGTILVACSMGRNVITVELEQKFVDMQKGNWQKIQERGPMMGYQMGQATILQGDARNLSGLLVKKIITSPPYAITGVGDWQTSRVEFQAWVINEIATLPYGSIDKVITSPPYAETTHHSDDPSEVIKLLPGRKGRLAGTAGNSKGQIGYLKPDSYLEAMRQVYSECHKVLKDGGLMCLVLKNFIRNKAIVRLDLDTIKRCESVGFSLKERHERKLTQQSFWRTIYKQKYPDAPEINQENLLVMEKR